jgi:NADPH-dependent curcumin reductase CurA
MINGWRSCIENLIAGVALPVANLAGCRAVAIAGNEDKLQWCREIGFDAGINYKKATDLTAVVKESCPKPRE